LFNLKINNTSRQTATQLQSAFEIEIKKFHNKKEKRYRVSEQDKGVKIVKPVT